MLKIINLRRGEMKILWFKWDYDLLENWRKTYWNSAMRTLSMSQGHRLNIPTVFFFWLKIYIVDLWKIVNDMSDQSVCWDLICTQCQTWRTLHGRGGFGGFRGLSAQLMVVGLRQQHIYRIWICWSQLSINMFHLW